jgi:flagellin-like protein
LAKKRGLSELTATIILIVIAVIVGAVVYELYISSQHSTAQSAASQAYSVVNSAGGNPASSFYANAEVSVTVIACDQANGKCTLQLTNTGNADAQANGCTISGAQGTISPNPALIQAGSSAQVTCAGSVGQGSPGSQVSGLVLLSNGFSASWTGTWQ